MRRCSSYRQAKVVQRADQRGQILVLFTLAVVAMIAMVGLVIDGGSAFAQRRGQQNVADLAALAGADALLNGQTQAQATTVAKNVATSNSYTDGAGGVVINVTFPAGKVQVDVSAPHPTTSQASLASRHGPSQPPQRLSQGSRIPHLARLR